MNSLEANKIVGAGLGVVFLMFGGSLVAEGIFHSEAPETPGYEVAVAEPEEGGDGGGAAEETVAPIAARLQTASAEAGATDFKKCSACHSAAESGENKIGPGLWEVVNRPIASHAGFDYSQAMTDFSEGGSVVWDYEHLDHFLENPKGYISGTKMGFAGIKDSADRADTIAYLRSLAANPAPLPEAPAAEETAATEGESVEAPGTETNPSNPEDQTNAQAPGTTDTETAAAMPGQETAPVMSEETRPNPPAAQIQEENAPAAPTGGDTSASGEQGAAAAGAANSEPAGETETAAATPAAITGDPAAGEKVFNRCKACHAVGEGAANKIGPELNGIVGEPIAQVEGYNFSQGLKDYAAEHPTWTVEELTAWLENPKAVVPSTKMSFPGLKSEEDIQNVIAYLAQFGEDGSKSGN
ncbi:Cytochrome c2 [Fulvimarina manganoxydans]|uniref:Cytochrome c2 n=1 Tax=Fulvimarina manganoxydans TaxID=937218 RepID=A0A1W1YEF3_9HYPH|nr:cytochrome c family protein [Fulvimarina manganoxydans]SMC34547.1 Cytochrome c2 [Fulvimarina manganoxydans]